MSVLRSKDGNELIVTCTCGCEDAIHIRVDKDPWDMGFDDFALMSYMSGNWYHEQNQSMWDVIRLKFKKIWRIIRNKDHHYSDIRMTAAEWDEFKHFINEV